LRIALVPAQIAPIRDPQIGGAQVIVADLARGLASRGHEVAVFAPRGSCIDGVEVVETGIDADELRPTLNRGASVSDPRASAAFQHVFDLVNQGVWDCVHNHAFDAPAITAATSVRCPVVHTLHLPRDPIIAGAIAQFVHARPIVVAVSAAAARQWAELITVDAVIRNGVPVARIPWSRSAGDGLLFVGRRSPEKGADIAVEVAARSGMRITVIGGAYDEEWAARLVDRTDPSKVEFLPAMAREDVWVRMSRASALIAMPRWEEPFGLSAAEAQAGGTPVIAARRGALPEIVRDGTTGFIVDDVDKAVAAAGRIAVIDRSACRRHAEAELDITPMLDAYERLYEAGARVVRRT
jgi:glycosyltransferase involved in cell wall biosynthesis